MKLTDRYKSLSDLPIVVPVFPLRGAILLPRAGLPLNIFEPRYLALFNDILAGNRLVCIVQPDIRANADVDPRTAFLAGESPQGRDVQLRTVGTIGRLTAFQEMDDGRMIVSISGVARCALGAEVDTQNAYRTFNVTIAAFEKDLTQGTGEGEVPRDELLAALKGFLDARDLSADWDNIKRLSNEPLVNSLSVMSPYGPEEKQALLEAGTLKARAEILIALAQMELASSGNSSSSGSTLQ
ncbi:MAG: LON peptidase substrate-binding domain-containing protein [Hyphomicrobiaceae bacterium]|nr:peptidase S16 [Hyphomicrobiaceae bacterium]